MLKTAMKLVAIGGLVIGLTACVPGAYETDTYSYYSGPPASSWSSWSYYRHYHGHWHGGGDGGHYGPPRQHRHAPAVVVNGGGHHAGGHYGPPPAHRGKGGHYGPPAAKHTAPATIVT